MTSFRGRGVLGVFGGTFDPPHLGHVLLPSYLRARAMVDHLLVAPCADHPLGKAMSSFEDRLAWTRVAMGMHGGAVEVSDIEAQLAARKGGPSYTLRLLEAVAERYPEARVRLVVGSDILQTGETKRWHRWDRIVERFEPLVVPRAGYAADAAMALPEVSSTEIRRRLRRGTDEDWAVLHELVPAAVLDMIRRARQRSAPIWIIGRGHVSAHAEPWLRARGRMVRIIAGRDAASGATAWPEEAPGAVWILVRDAAIAAVAASLRGRLPAATVVLHAAGALPSTDARGLGVLAEAGHPVGTLHPICSLRAERSWPSRLERAAFGVEGHPAARKLALSLVETQPWLDLQALDEVGRRAYHGACALAANYLSVLQDAAGAVLRGQGHPPVSVDAALDVLMRSALDNLLALGIPAGITGPIARGDTATVEGHLQSLDPETAELYRLLSQRLERIVVRASSDG